jgi:hypothetical protein
MHRELYGGCSRILDSETGPVDSLPGTRDPRRKPGSPAWGQAAFRRLRAVLAPGWLLAFRCVPAGVSAVADLYLGGQRKRLAYRADVCLEQAPTSGLFVVRVGTNGSASERALIGIDASGRIGARAGGTGGLLHGPTLEPGRWYRIDLVYDTSDENNYTLDWQLDGLQQAQATHTAGVAADIVTVGLGYEGTGSSGRCYVRRGPLPAGPNDRPIPFPSEVGPGLTPPIGPRLLQGLRDTARRWAQDARLLLLDLTRHPRRPGCTRKTRECCIYTWGTDAVMPECCVSHMKELAFFLEDLLTRNRITHWLDFGALLGAVRNGELIPWDQDLDFGVYSRDHQALLALGPEITAAGYHFEPETLRVLYGPFNHNHVDFTLWEEEDGWLGYGDPPWSFPRSYVEQFDDVRLYGKAFPAPSPVHRFLNEHRYGPGYMTPRRPILNAGLRPSVDAGEIDLAIHHGSRPDLNPFALAPVADEIDRAILELLDRLTDADWRLLERLGSRFFHPVVWAGRVPGPLRLWQRWVVAGLSGLPDQNRVEQLRRDLPGQAVGPAAEQLMHSLALVEQALDDLDRPGGSLRRTSRRFAWLGGLTAARIRRTQPPPRFPYGL